MDKLLRIIIKLMLSISNTDYLVTLECCFANRDSISMSVVCAVLNGELLPDNGGFEYINLASSNIVRHNSLT